MLSIKEFIKEQAISRANAANALSEPLEINGIHFLGGCDCNGIFVYGVKELAKALDLEVQEEAGERGRYKQYIKLNGCEFYEYVYRSEEKENVSV